MLLLGHWQRAMISTYGSKPTALLTFVPRKTVWCPIASITARQRWLLATHLLVGRSRS